MGPQEASDRVTVDLESDLHSQGCHRRAECDGILLSIPHMLQNDTLQNATCVAFLHTSRNLRPAFNFSFNDVKCYC